MMGILRVLCTGTLLALCVLPVIANSAVFLTLCDGLTHRCVNPRLGCIPVVLCYLQPMEYPPHFSLNNGTFSLLRSVEYFSETSQNHTTASFCVQSSAFETSGEVQIWVMPASSRTSTNINPVILHAIQGENQQCYVVQEVHDREFILIKVAVENDQTCFKEANITCSVTAISGLRMTPQPVYIEVGHGTFNFTGFQRCLQYSAICYILHDGYQPAICEADIDEFMRPLPPNILKADWSSADQYLTLTLMAQTYFCSEQGIFVGRILNDSNQTVATFEKCLTEMQEVNQTLVLRVVLTTVASLQPYTALTVVLTAVDNSTGEENRTSPSVSKIVQWTNTSSDGVNNGLITPIVVPVVAALILIGGGVLIGVVLAIKNGKRCPGIITHHEPPDSSSNSPVRKQRVSGELVSANQHNPVKYFNEMGKKSAVVVSYSTQMPLSRGEEIVKQNTARSKDEFERKEQRRNDNSEVVGWVSQDMPPAEMEQIRKTVQVSGHETSSTGESYTDPTLPLAATNGKDLTELPSPCA